MMTTIAYTYDETGDGHIRAVLSGMGGLIAARRGDTSLFTDLGLRTRSLFDLVMGPPPDDEEKPEQDAAGEVKKPVGLAEGITDVYTELADDCCTIVVCWVNTGVAGAETIGRKLHKLLYRVVADRTITIDQTTFWLVQESATSS